MSDKTIGKVRPDGFPAGANDGEVDVARERVEGEAKKVFTDNRDLYPLIPLVGLIEKEMDDFAYYARLHEGDEEGIEARKVVVSIVLTAIGKVGYALVEQDHIEDARQDSHRRQEQLAKATVEIKHLEEQVKHWKKKYQNKIFAND